MYRGEQMKETITLELEEHTIDSIMRLSAVTNKDINTIVEIAVDEYAGQLSVLEQTKDEE